MTKPSDHSKITGVALIRWRLKTETPLCIKSGTTSVCTKDGEIDFWNKSKSKEDESGISDFYFDVRLKKGGKDNFAPVFCIPASSIRGALRNYTIKRLVPDKKLQRAALLEKVEDEKDCESAMKKQNNLLLKALEEPGWRLIRNLFGLAADSGLKKDEIKDPEEKKLDKETVATRLHVMSDDEIMTDENINDENAPFTVVPQSPVDRVTRGTKDGGLHHFMELKQGYEFSVCFRLLNPTPEDLGFFTFWEQSVNQGLIRLGGLIGVGKGKLRVKETKVRLFTWKPERFGLEDKPLEKERKKTADAIMAMLFPEYAVNWDELKHAYFEQLKHHFNQMKKGE